MHIPSHLPFDQKLGYHVWKSQIIGVTRIKEKQAFIAKIVFLGYAGRDKDFRLLYEFTQSLNVCSPLITTMQVIQVLPVSIYMFHTDKDWNKRLEFETIFKLFYTWFLRSLFPSSHSWLKLDYTVNIYKLWIILLLSISLAHLPNILDFDYICYSYTGLLTFIIYDFFIVPCWTEFYVKWIYGSLDWQRWMICSWCNSFQVSVQHASWQNTYLNLGIASLYLHPFPESTVLISANLKKTTKDWRFV